MSDINEESPKWGSKQSLVFFFGYYKYRYCTSSKGKRCLTLSLFKFLCLKLFHRSVFFLFIMQPLLHHALVQVLDEEELAELELPSSSHLSRLRRRAFMKKLLTVVSSRPSC